MAAAAEATLETKPITLEAKPIMQTSLGSRRSSEGEVTVQFRKWTAHGNTAYQKGQYAGFPIAVALGLRDRGAVILDPAFGREPANKMVRK
jgi:hypothetical protein